MRNSGPIKKMSVIPFLLAFLAVMPASVAHASGTKALTVTAAVLSKSKCKFNTANATLNFGALDPGSPGDVTQTASIQFVCNGSAPTAAFAFTTDDGLYESGPGANRMRHAAPAITEFLPYSLSLGPNNGTVLKGVTQTLAVTGTVSALDFRSALAGNYADTVIITLSP